MKAYLYKPVEGTVINLHGVVFRIAHVRGELHALVGGNNVFEVELERLDIPYPITERTKHNAKRTN
jgi:hypothetical protein